MPFRNGFRRKKVFSHAFLYLQSKCCSSRGVSVKQYRWINIWMAILGHLADGLPAVFCFRAAIIEILYCRFFSV
ncbi:MAG: DUF2684 family protein [Candidatus Symbiopectobacterium sp. Dall1.0]|nr:DUF2684 family protein [Candidatus Symbiopectobacterium sp. Dall1.0]